MNKFIYQKPPSGIYNVGSGMLTSNMKIVEIIESIMVGTNIYSSLLNKNNKVQTSLSFYANVSKVKKYLNWKPKTNIKKGIKKILNRYYG